MDVVEEEDVFAADVEVLKEVVTVVTESVVTPLELVLVLVEVTVLVEVEEVEVLDVVVTVEVEEEVEVVVLLDAPPPDPPWNSSTLLFATSGTQRFPEESKARPSGSLKVVELVPCELEVKSVCPRTREALIPAVNGRANSRTR